MSENPEKRQAWTYPEGWTKNCLKGVLQMNRKNILSIGNTTLKPLIFAILLLTFLVPSHLAAEGIAEQIPAESDAEITLISELEITALPSDMQSIVAISAFIANGDSQNLARVIGEGLDNGLTVSDIGEIILQSYAYAGFPRALNAQGVLGSVLEERAAEGITDSYGEEPAALPEGVNRYALGVTNLSKLMGFPLNQKKAETNGYSDAMDAFLKEHLFADIFARDTLTFDRRELATVSILAALEGTNSQQMFHMSAAMTSGITEDEMNDMVSIITNELGKERGENAAAVLSQVLERRASMPAAPAASEPASSYPYIPEIFPLGQPSGNETIFTGDTWVGPLVPFDNPAGLPIVNVTFSPDSRTTWHAHSYVQVLLVTLGSGYYQEEGKEAQPLKAGDSVVIPAGVTHWHGSAPGEWFAHIAIIVPVESDAQDLWLDPVAEAEYSLL